MDAYFLIIRLYSHPLCILRVCAWVSCFRRRLARPCRRHRLLLRVILYLVYPFIY